MEPDRAVLDSMDGMDRVRGAEPPPLPVGKPWGFWVTLGLTLVIVAGALGAMITMLFAIAAVIWQFQNHDTYFEFTRTVFSNRIALGVSGAIGGAVELGLTVLFVRLRKGITIRNYLALQPVPLHVLSGWLAVSSLATCLLIVSMISQLNPNRVDISPILVWVPHFAAGRALLPAIALQVLLFGFLYRGISMTRIGSYRTVLFVTLAIACIAVMIVKRFELRTVAYLILIALYGVARIRTGSLYVSFTMDVLSRILIEVVVIAVKLST